MQAVDLPIVLAHEQHLQRRQRGVLAGADVAGQELRPIGLDHRQRIVLGLHVAAAAAQRSGDGGLEP